MDSIAPIFLSSFIIALSGAMMPGPLLTKTVSESPRCGTMTGPLLIAGHGILEFGLLLLLFFGLAPILRSNTIIAGIAFIGGIILLWSAAEMFRSIPHASIPSQVTTQHNGRLITSGILMSMANPYWTIWWATIGLGYVVHSEKFGFPGVIAFFCGHILADLVWYTSISVAITKGKRFISARLYKAIIAICGGMMIAFAIYFVVNGFRKLIG